jgi:outer membrane protein OmpA-like peptidoglycan-associated protein
MRTAFVALLTHVLCFISLLGQESMGRSEMEPYVESFAARLQGGVVYTLYDASFSSTGDVLDCGQLTSGSGWNPTISATLEFPFTPTLGLGIGIGYTGRSGILSRQNTYPTRDSAGLEGTMTSELTLDATMTYLEIQPDIRWSLLGENHDRRLGLILGPRIGLPLTTEFIQQEVVIAPENASFVIDGQRTQQRHVASGPFTTRSNVMIGVSAGVETFVPVSSRVDLVPQISFDYWFTNMVSDATWSNIGIRAEIGVRWSAGTQRQHERPIPPPPPPPVIITPPQIAIQFDRFEGEVVTGNHLTATLPIVNAVFFDSASFMIPTTYRRQHDASRISSDPVAAHEWVLPRIASLLDHNAEATIILEGAGDESLTIGKQRAEAVKNALIDLGVSPSRVVTVGRTSPRIPSNTAFEGGRAENRRVDIVVKEAPLQEWVTLERFAVVRGTIGVSTFVSGGESDEGITTVIKLAGRDSTMVGRSARMSIPVEIEVEPDAANVKITTTASALGAFSQRDTTVSTNGLPRREIDLQTHGFEAILMFGYNSSELTPEVQQLLGQLAERLPEGSTVTIVGSADVLGSDARNKQLSEERAENTKRFIRSVAGEKLRIETSATSEQFSVDTPQGRFLNRSIRLTARTP